jgi:hypothetical protein
MGQASSVYQSSLHYYLCQYIAVIVYTTLIYITPVSFHYLMIPIHLLRKLPVLPVLDKNSHFLYQTYIYVIHAQHDN